MIDEALIDYNKCHEYARALCGTCGIPECDVADIGSDAFLLAIRRAWRADDAAGNPEAVARRLMYTSVLNVINRRSKNTNRMIREADDISATDERDDEPTDDERPDTGLVVSDNGRGVGAIDGIAWDDPLWLRLFEYERKKLWREQKNSPLAYWSIKIIKAGLKDTRLAIIRNRLKISGRRFSAILSFFKMRFGLCFQALQAWRGER